MKRLLLVFFILPLLTTCEMFDNDMPAFLDFYTGTAKIESHLVDGSYIEDSNGKIHISPGEGRTINFHLNNPQEYDLNLGINWNNSLMARTATESPVQDIDYTLVQDTNNKSLIRLILKQPFLEETDKEAGGGDISATINLAELKSGREFESYFYSLESNSPPPPFDYEDVFLMKNTADEYVLCFKLPHVTTADPTHQDIETLEIKNNSNGSDIDYTIDFTGGKRGDDAVTPKTNIIAYTYSQLSPWLTGEPVPGNNYYTDQDVIFYNTKLPAGGSINYTVTLIDDKGLSSEAVISSEPPTIGGTIGVTINEVSGTVLHEGEYYTKNPTVTLRLSAVTDNVSGVTAYHTTDGNKPAADAIWQNWNGNSPADSPAHTLPGNDGVKYIYVWIKDATGNLSVAAIVKVTLTTKVPEITVTIKEEAGTIHVSGTTYSTRNSTVTLRLTAEISERGVTGYQITNDGNQPATNTGAWESWNGNNPVNNLAYTLKNINPQTIYVWVKDATGNVSTATDVAQVTVTRGTIEPTFVAIKEEPGTVRDAAGKYYTQNNFVTLRLYAISNESGVVAYQITNSSDKPAISSGSWESWDGKNTTYSPPHDLVRPLTPGDITIYVWLKDSGGNVSDVAKTVEVTVNPRTVYLDTVGGNNGNIGTELSKPVKTMDKAIALLGGNDFLWSDATIFLKSTIAVSTHTDWSPATPLTLKRYSPFDGSMITVSGGSILTLENIILDGENKWSNGSLISVRSSTLQIGNGVILKDNLYGIRGAGINLKRSILNMYGNAEISGNTVATRWHGGGVYMAETSTFNMYDDAKITNNHTYNEGTGGGVHMENNGSVERFNMHGGTISGNTSDSGAGGVNMAYFRGIFNMYGGTISGNISSYGVGGVKVGSIFTMIGGTIRENRVLRGGVSAVNGSFTLHGGIITRNTGGAGPIHGVIKRFGGIIVENTPKYSPPIP